MTDERVCSKEVHVDDSSQSAESCVDYCVLVEFSDFGELDVQTCSEIRQSDIMIHTFRGRGIPDA